MNWMGPPAQFDVPSVRAVSGGAGDAVSVAVAGIDVTPAHVSEVVCYADGAADRTLLVDSAVSLQSVDRMPASLGGPLTVSEGGAVVAFTADSVLDVAPQTMPSELLTHVGEADFSPAAAVPSAAAPPPSAPRTPCAEKLCRSVTAWASQLCRQLTGDADGRWCAATAAFLENWALLPAPGQLKALEQFGHVPGVGPPSEAAAKPAPRPLTALPTEDVGTQVGGDEPPPPVFCQKLCVLRDEARVLGSMPFRSSRTTSFFRRIYGEP